MNLKDLKIGDSFLPVGTSQNHEWTNQPIHHSKQLKVKIISGGHIHTLESIFAFGLYYDKWIELGNEPYEWKYTVTKVNKKTIEVEWDIINLHCRFSQSTLDKPFAGDPMYSFTKDKCKGLIKLDSKQIVSKDYDIIHL